MCTSFAVYFNDPIYAMNIDHPDRERKFKITTLKCNKGCIGSGQCGICNLRNNPIIRFHCQNRENNRFLDSACMNSLGMFSNYQFLIPNKKMEIPKPKSKKISDGNLFSQSQMYTGTVSELIKRIGDKTVYYSDLFGSFKLHNMFADKEGHSFILESGEKGNAITHQHDKYIVMTNFPVYEFEGRPYSEVYGDGSDRYKTACNEITRNRENFGVVQAFDILEKVRHTSEYFPTVCSMVFDPLKLYVYVALFGDFKKIWRISITENIIESYIGFEKDYKFRVGNKGILASELEKYI